MAEDSANFDPRSLPPRAELLVTPGEVSAALDALAGKLQPLVDEGPCVLVSVLLGGLMPTAWLAERLVGDFQLDYCHVTRYQGRQKGAVPVWLRPPSLDIRSAHVIVIDDIYDEGITLEYVRRECQAAGARRVTSVALVKKSHDRAAGRAPADFVGLEVPDRYVFGCGMDLAHHWRHLSGIYALQEVN
jgi:hypoxanthine phosphoribosyltransferase